METCGKCMGSGYGGHPDSGALCPDCNGSGGIRADLMAELVEALRCAVDDYEAHNGRIVSDTDPHWSVSARAALAKVKEPQHG